MHTKQTQFLVTFTSDDQTRFLQDDAFIALQLKFIAASVGKSVTLGSQPMVTCDVHRPQGELLAAAQRLK